MTDIVERLLRLVPSDPSGASIDAIAEIERLRAALRGVIRVADRNTAEFNEARAALATQPAEEERT